MRRVAESYENSIRDMDRVSMIVLVEYKRTLIQNGWERFAEVKPPREDSEEGHVMWGMYMLKPMEL